MAPNFQSSFIPKQSSTQETFKKQKYGIAGTFAFLLFLLSLVVAGGLFFYEKLIQGEIEDLKSQLTTAEGNIDREAIAELSNFDSKLRAADTLVDRHTVVSNFIKIVASSTVSSVRFNRLDYRFAQDNTLIASLRGEATSYAALALQEDVFLKEPNVNSIVFSELKLADGGLVEFGLDMVIDSKVSLYAPLITEIPVESQQQEEDQEEPEPEPELELEESQTTQ